MNKPIRVQRKRVKGWRMPENTISVCRPGKWGNPFSVLAQIEEAKDEWGKFGLNDPVLIEQTAHQQAVNLFKAAVMGRMDDELTAGEWERITWIKTNISTLKGKNLACFCPLDSPCHADVLLELANPTTPC